VYLAFHSKCPHHYLSHESLESLRANGGRCVRACVRASCVSSTDRVESRCIDSTQFFIPPVRHGHRFPDFILGKIVYIEEICAGEVRASA